MNISTGIKLLIKKYLVRFEIHFKVEKITTDSSKVIVL